MGEEPAVDQKTRVVVDDQKQLGANRGVDLGERDPWSDEHVCDPAFVRAVGLVATEHLWLGLECFTMKPRRRSWARMVRSATLMPWR